MSSSSALIAGPDLRQILEVLLPRYDPAPAGAFTRLSHGGTVEVAHRGDRLCVYGVLPKNVPEIMVLLANTLEQHSSEIVNRVLLIDPLAASTEVQSIEQEWSSRPHPFKFKAGSGVSLKLQVWGAQAFREQMRLYPPLELRYFSDDVPDGRARLERIEAARRSYLERNRAGHGKIEFVGMSVYKEEATVAVDLESLYIPLHVVGEAANESDSATPRVDPLRLLSPGERHVILG